MALQLPLPSDSNHLEKARCSSSDHGTTFLGAAVHCSVPPSLAKGVGD